MSEPYTTFLLSCPHCGVQSNERLHEPMNGGGSRHMILKGECGACREPWKVDVKITVEKAK